jgi:imidazole glycerol-phosphate synthase subunit HisF
MLAFRILTTLLIRDGLLVKGKNFINDRRVGGVLQTVNVFQQREIDEMAIVDITASKDNRLIDYKFVDDITSNCFMPLAFGGGVKTIEDVRLLLNHGADKIIIGSNFSERLVNEVAKELGSQSVCVSIDYSGDSVFLYSGTRNISKSVLEYAKSIEDAGAGEIILSSIEREGTLSGYDYPLIEKVCKNAWIPIVASGGAATWEDFYRVYNCGASGASAGALYQFTQETPRNIKKKLKEKGVPIR